MHKVSQMKTLGVPPTLGMNGKSIGKGVVPTLPMKKANKKKSK